MDETRQSDEMVAARDAYEAELEYDTELQDADGEYFQDNGFFYGRPCVGPHDDLD